MPMSFLKLNYLSSIIDSASITLHIFFFILFIEICRFALFLEY